MSDTIIKVENISKEYRLGAIGGATLVGELQSWWARVRGKEDPNSKIGAKSVKVGEKFLALDGISFEVKKGERVGIIGHNGAGKSTFLKLLSRVTAPTKGTISYNGRISSMLEVGTGFHPELTGRENVYMNGAILGMTKKEIDSKFDDIVKFAEMEQFIDTPVKRYSSGMYVKLAFAVAAHLDSEIMIMDEVLAVGDMKFQKKCLGKMGDVSKSEGRTILYVSHNMNTIRQLCTRCIVLDHGKMIFDGDVEEAIGIYMQLQEDHRTSYDYSDVPRSINETRAFQLTGLDILHRDSNKLKKTELLEFAMHGIANQDVENIGIRFELFYLDGSIVGTVFTNKQVSAKKGQRVDIDMSFSVRNLAPGKYTAVALAYERDENGNQVGLDRVSPALSFEVTYESNSELVWLHNYWGHIHFDDLVVNRISYD